MVLVGLVLLSLCWGSFLNVLGYRLVRGQNVVCARSQCPHCRHRLPWYENIPVISWLFLRGHCSACQKPISILYPAIEILTALVVPALWYACPARLFPAYFVLFSALIVTIRSDLETMLISRVVTLFVMPIALVASFWGGLFVCPLESVLGGVLGYFSLFTISRIFSHLTGREGMGEGDFELLGLIGSFVGPWYCWQSLLIGSCVGSVYGLALIYLTGADRARRIPFGPFLAAAAMLVVLLHWYAPGLLAFPSAC